MQFFPGARWLACAATAVTTAMVLLAPAHAAGPLEITNAAATDTEIILTVDGTYGGDVAVREESLFPPLQLWTQDGFGAAIEARGRAMRMTFSDPAPDPFDPFITNPKLVDADAVGELAMRVRVTNGPASIPMAVYAFPYKSGALGSLAFNFAPTGDWQTVRVDLAGIAGASSWEGARALRIDFAEGQGDWTVYQDTVVEIEWIAVTDDPAFDGTFTMNPVYRHWRFTHVDQYQSGPVAAAVTIPRFGADGRDRMYRLFTMVDAATGDPVSNTHAVTDMGGLSYTGDTYDGWYPGGPGTIQDKDSGALQVRFYDPSPSGFDPSISNMRPIPADSLDHIAMRVRVPFAGPVNVVFRPYLFEEGFSGVVGPGPGATANALGNWQILRFDMSAVSGWEGIRTIRMDMYEAQGWEPTIASVTMDIDWIAITNDPAYNGGPVGPDEILFDFEFDADFQFEDPDSVKGLQVQLLDDAIELGVNHAGQNFTLPAVADVSGGVVRKTWRADGVTVPLVAAGQQGADRQTSRLYESGAEVTMIVLNTMGEWSGDPVVNPLFHPLTDQENKPTFSVAINTADEYGWLMYRAIMESTARRYSEKSAPAGRIRNYVIGNELQSHYAWYNLGDLPAPEVIENYAVAMRTADIAIRSNHPEARAMVSMDHFWTGRFNANSLRAMSGEDFLYDFAAFEKQRGDYPWGLAHHPYPENLFDPAFWQDTTAPMSYSADKITFNNVELLPLILTEPEVAYEGGEVRRLMFTEQGFHSDETTEGEELQAAAYAAAWHKIKNIPAIRGFILHRHVDFRGEGGLNLGLWRNDDDDPFPATPTTKKPIWFVFRDADTPDWPSAFAFALPVVGISDWDEALPTRTGIEFLFEDGSAEGWDPTNQVTGFGVANGALGMQSTGGDPFIEREKMFFPAERVEEVLIRLKVDAGSAGQLFWFTEAESFASEAKSISFPLVADGQFQDYYLDVASVPEWDGFITGLRFDPSNAGSANIEIDFIIGGLAGEVGPPAAVAEWTEIEY